MSYVSPIALFLFCVFLMFAVASLTGLTEIPTKQIKADVAERSRSGKRRSDSRRRIGPSA